MAETIITNADDLKGREFWSINVTENDNTRPLVPNTRIKLRFNSNGITLGVGAGCNYIQIDYTIDNNNTLISHSIGMTEMGCETTQHYSAGMSQRPPF